MRPLVTICAVVALLLAQSARSTPVSAAQGYPVSYHSFGLSSGDGTTIKGGFHVLHEGQDIQATVLGASSAALKKGATVIIHMNASTRYQRDGNGNLIGNTLQQDVLAGLIDPGNLSIVREIVNMGGPADVDTANFRKKRVKPKANAPNIQP